MRRGVIKVPTELKGRVAMMKDRKKAKDFLKMMIAAIQHEHDWKNRRRVEGVDKDE